MLLSTEKADIDLGDVLGGLAPPPVAPLLLGSDILSFKHFGLIEIGTNPDEVGSRNEGIPLNKGGDDWDVDGFPGGEAVACKAAAATAAACCCCC